MEKISSRTNTQLIREAFIREQLKKMLPHVELIDIILCAHEMSKLISNFSFDPQHNGGKC